MAFHAKQRLFYYKKYKLDIWGILKNTLYCKRPNYFLALYGKKLGYYKYLDRKKTKIYKKQMLYRAYFFRKKDKKDKNEGFYWHGFRITKECKEWLPKYWLSSLWMHMLRLRIILYSNLFFGVFKNHFNKKLSLIAHILIKKQLIRKKIYYRMPFIYEVRAKVPRKKRNRPKVQFTTLRLARLFYIMYNYKHLKKLNYKAKKQDGIFEQNYLQLMECKLASFIYRSSFFSNMFESIMFIKYNNIWVNKKFIPFIYYNINVMDIVGFRIWYKVYIFWNFFKRLRRRAFIFLLPKFIYTSFQFLWFLLIRIPKRSDIINPISVDLYRISTYAK